MLLIAAALLTASMHSLGVVEAPVVPTVQTAAVVTTTAVAPVEPVQGPVPVPVSAGPGDADAVDLETLARARGREFLDDLVAVDPRDLERADADDRVLATAQDHPPTALDVATWWAGLPSATRSRLVAAVPAVVGNLDGVPFDVRDRANRLTLRTGLADPGTDTARAALLGQVDVSLQHAQGGAPRSLVALDTRGAGRAAIAVGDLDTADDVTVVVPGMFYTVTGQMHDLTDTSAGLHDEQAAAAGAGRGEAVLAWMGYRTPDMSNILSLDLARTGAERLERVVDGLEAVRGDDRPRLNVVAHSYGSTTALMALSSGRMQADTLTVLGSPGSDVRTASQLAVHRGQVYVGDAHSDPIAGSGYFGTDPGSPGFGSVVLDLSAAPAPSADGVFRRPVGHNDYLKPGTASLHDVALIAVGRGDLVRDQAQHGRGGGHAPGTAPDMYLVRPQDLQPRD
ncbi:alpha/beta hydrolase [Curtobacterium citri]|uniref:Alpha/beta hydrolase n=1 Tax=Curtobacterium citri TaxID=3055139 RepID=A0ABT7T3P5_9MICO|nr:alpha/beta hydrolase [Curtobacterium citri]MDM7884202.1 alpha/beta hydrolase [Curtobacterium citri]